MATHKFSSLGRPMDYSDKTNVVIGIITMLTLVFAYLYLVLFAEVAWIDAIMPSLAAAFSVFISWAISREIDPDYPIAAFFGVTFIIILIVNIDNILEPHYIPLLWMLLFQRILNRTVGYKARMFDSVLTLGLTIWLSFTYSWVTGILAAFVYWLDTTLKNPYPNHRVFAIFSLIISVVAFIIKPEFFPNVFNTYELILLITVSILFLAFIFMFRDVKSKADLTPQILNKQRIRYTQAFTLISLILFSVINGVDTFYGLAPLWCAMSGVFIHSLFIKSGKKTKYINEKEETIVK